MTDVTTTLLAFLREAWLALASATIIIVILAMLSQVLKATSASVLGSRYGVMEAFSAVTGLLALTLFGFLGVPALVEAVQPVSTSGCGPLADLGMLAAALIGALASLRMLKALLVSAAASAVGGSSVISGALIEAGEAVFGMTLAAVASPVAAYFLGTC